MLNKNITASSERIKLGIHYLENTDFSNVENGKYEISGSEVFAIVQDYTSKPLKDAQFEAHKKYTDIQYIVKGEEKIGIGKIEDFLEATPYDIEKDIVFLGQKDNAKTDFIILKEKEFAIFTPNDAHMPSIAIDSPNYVRKVVVKVLI